MTEVLFLYIMPVYESRRLDYWSLIKIDWCIQYIWLLYHFLFDMSVNKIWIFKLCEWLIESKVGVSFFDSSFGRQSTVCIPKFWYNLPIIYFYSVFVAEYKYPNVSVWFYSDQYALNVIRLFVHVDQLKWVMPLFEHVYTVEIIFILYNVQTSIHICDFQVVPRILAKFLLVPYSLPKTRKPNVFQIFFVINLQWLVCLKLIIFFNRAPLLEHVYQL